MWKRRIKVVAVALLLLLGIVLFAWEINDWPPLLLILEYGLPPAGGPTGRTTTFQGMEFVELSPGYFRMGSHFGCEKGDFIGRICAGVGLPWGTPPDHQSGECPQRWIEIPRAFWIAKTEVTNRQFTEVVEDLRRDESLVGDDHPRTGLSWDEACRFCDLFSARSGVSARLPTEAEWEYASRAGTRTEFWFGDRTEHLQWFAWCYRAGGKWKPEEICVVGTRPPNPWGLHDTHGNVAEWCSDHVDGPSRIARGGSWYSEPEECRSAARKTAPHDVTADWVGFRLVYTIPKDE